jgi:hypothetical protein
VYIEIAEQYKQALDGIMIFKYQEYQRLVKKLQNYSKLRSSLKPTESLGFIQQFVKECILFTCNLYPKQFFKLSKENK